VNIAATLDLFRSEPSDLTSSLMRASVTFLALAHQQMCRAPPPAALSNVAPCRASRQLGKKSERAEQEAFPVRAVRVKKLLIDCPTMRMGCNCSPRTLVSNFLQPSTVPRELD
jgi:hypothetical protein